MDFSQNILNLVYRYAECIDSGDFDGLGLLFRCGSIEYPTAGQVLRGSDAITEFYRKTIQVYADTGTPCTNHAVSNVIIEADILACTAIARSCFSVTQQLVDFPHQVIATGRYFDHFKYDGKAWCFTGRKVTPEYYGDMSMHLKSFLDERDGLRLVSKSSPTNKTAIKRI